MSPLIQDILRPLLHDLFVYRRHYVAAAVAVLAFFVVVGVFWPGRYTSAVTIFVEQRNILGPLMEGAAVQTDVQAQAGLARELIFGRRILGTVAREQGLVSDSMAPADADRIMEEIKDRTAIELVGENLIEIEYSDSDPDRTYSVTAQFAELFINESKASKINESQAAYDFIDRQVEQYAARLDQISNDIKAFRSANQSIVPGTEAEIRSRIEDLRAQIESQQQQIREAEVKAASLRAQLSGEHESASVAAETDQLQQRIAALQARLDTLQLSYHDKYPDVIALKTQIEDLKSLAQQGGAVVPAADAEAASATDGREGQALFNAVGQQLRTDLYNTTTEIATLKARVDDSRRMLEVENERVRKIPEFEARLAELNRDLQVNQTLYNDLIRRREYARVSMNVDTQNQGLTLRIHEPAAYPTHASGPRLLHFIVIGLFMAFSAPLGALLAKQRIDQRIRVSDKVDGGDFSLPILIEVPHLTTPAEARGLRLEYAALAFVLVLAVTGAGATGVLRLLGHV